MRWNALDETHPLMERMQPFAARGRTRLASLQMMHSIIATQWSQQSQRSSDNSMLLTWNDTVEMKAIIEAALRQINKVGRCAWHAVEVQLRRERAHCGIKGGRWVASAGGRDDSGKKHLHHGEPAEDCRGYTDGESSYFSSASARRARRVCGCARAWPRTTLYYILQRHVLIAVGTRGKSPVCYGLRLFQRGSLHGPAPRGR